MIRQLATIQQITELNPIEGADKIEVASILGWKTVIGREEFKVGDLVVYCEVDSVLPEIPEFEFLRSRCFVDNGIVKGFRLRTIRLKGQFSQGLIVSLDVLKDKKYRSDKRENPVYNFTEGMDVTSLIGIEKFERPIPACMQGKVKGDFPSFIPKSDETRVQVLQGLLDKYKGIKCYVTEKIDGTSSTFFLKDGEFGVCSRNLELAKEDSTYHEKTKYGLNRNKKYQVIQEDGNLIGEEFDVLPEPKQVNENVYWKIARIYEIENRLKYINRELAIQGEIYGEGLQKNPLQIKGQKIAIFNIYDILEHRYLSLKEMKDVLHVFNYEVSILNVTPDLIMTPDLVMVPILSEDFILINNIDELIEQSKSNSIINKDCKREGIVIRPVENIYDNDYSEECKTSRISFKCINPEYLLRND